MHYLERESTIKNELPQRPEIMEHPQVKKPPFGMTQPLGDKGQERHLWRTGGPDTGKQRSHTARS